MKIIKPIVGISKIIENYEALVVGFNGVLYNGESVNTEALKALRQAALCGKKISVLSNSPLRVRKVAEILSSAWRDLSFLSSVVTAGEVLHFCLKTPSKLGLSGRRYYNLGGDADTDIFEGLDYVKVADLSSADFVFLGNLKASTDDLSVYAQALEHGCALGLPLLCVGNDLAEFCGGHEALGCGAVAEQYAVLGGRIVTFGKPQLPFLNYAAESFKTTPDKILFIGDSMAADIKGGNLFGADTLLVSKGIHVSFLGEGYIPDVAKARHLATNFDAYSDYVISELRW